MISTEYLDEERKKLWKKVLVLEKDINKKTSDYEKEAKSASKKASEYRNRCEDARSIADGFVLEIKTKLESIDDLLIDIDNSKKLSDEKGTEIKGILESSNNNLNELIERKEKIQNHLTELETAFENHPELESEIEELNTAFTESDDLYAKISALHKNSLTKKKEIDSLFYEINGYKETDEESGEETEVEGLKDKLETTYDELNQNLNTLRVDLSEFKIKTQDDYKNFIETKNAVFNKKMDTWLKDYKAIQAKISNLLPNALTAGLSSAYSNKKENEEKEQKRLEKRFNLGIVGLVLVSLIPFLISLKSFVEGVELEEVIIRMPRLVLAILPLYIPVLWLAYSANKKMNLAKRLIEEYSHKEVLSKTFEGLSKQINDIEDVETSADLRLKLLYNILEVSSENPGKLISDYNKSDHPFMDALDKSVKLANVVDKLADIPGLSKLSQVLDKKSKRIVNNQAEKIDEVLEDYIEQEEVEEK